MRACTLILGAGVWLAASAALAATTSGKLVSTDIAAKQLTIEADGGARFLFMVNDGTNFVQNGGAIGLGDIPVHSRITVTTDPMPKEAPALTLATRIEVERVAPVVEGAPDAQGSARVDSAVPGGQSAVVPSADYAAVPAPAGAIPPAAVVRGRSLPLLALLGVVLLFLGVLALVLRRREH